MKKKSYSDPMMELLFFDGEDIICASENSADNDTDGSKLWGDTQGVSDSTKPVA